MDSYFAISEISGFKYPERNLPEYTFSEQDIDIKNAILKIISLAAAGADSDSYLTELEQVVSGSFFARRYDRLSLVLYAPGISRILITRRFLSGRWSFINVLRRLITHKRLPQFNAKPFYLQVDFSEVPSDVINFFNVGLAKRGAGHFEIGVDGLVIIGSDNKTNLFLPGDAYVRSIAGMKQLRNYLAGKYGDDYIRSAQIERFRSNSFLLSDFAISPLYRGLPDKGTINKKLLEDSCLSAISNILKNFREDKRFLPFYDPALDSYKNFESPERDPVSNPYYNILRHSGGGLACVFYEHYFQSGESVETIRQAIEYLKTRTVLYEQAGRKCGYIYNEEIASLGGSGLALYLVARYQLLTGDRSYDAFSSALAWHLIGQITSSGEFIYRIIDQGKKVEPEDNDKHFSLYYPGEALCGLAKYLAYAPEQEQGYIRKKIQLALNFLINIRPVEKAAEYPALPGNSWLMNAIVELWDYPEFRQENYSHFVFSDARKLIDHMYRADEVPYPDYAGGFFNRYGDYPLTDGARLEGLMAALELAVKLEDKQKQQYLWQVLKLGAWALARLVNNDLSLYPVKRPDRALGGIRQKYTRQWFRVDSVQHVVCLYSRMLLLWQKVE